VISSPSDGDPCTQVTSPAEAVECAEALLNASTKPGCGLWAARALTPLAGLLYAASPRGNNEGIRWLTRAAATLPDQGAADNARTRAARRWGPGWHRALTYLADEPLLSNALSRTLELHPRQRDSLVMTIREALSPWTQCGGERE
jgi:hypothetical protein